MTNWTNLLKGVELGELSPTSRRVQVDVPQKVVDFVTKLKEPGPNGRKQQATVEVPDGEDWMNLRAIFKAAGDKMEPIMSVTVKAIYADGDEVKTVNDKGSEVWVPKKGATPSWLQLTVGERRGGRKAATNGDESASADLAADVDVPAK